MKILLVQETDWLNKGPFQQNHLIEKLSLRSHKIRVIDHEILWREQEKKELFSKRQVFNGISKIYQGSKVTLIRPGVIKLPNLDYISLAFTRRKEINYQIKQFQPDVIIGFHILSAYLGMQAAKRCNIPFIYYWVDVYHTQISFKPYQFIGKMIEKKTLQNAHRVITINEKLKDYVIRMGSDPAKTCVIKGSVDLKRFDPTIDTSKMKKQYGIKDSDIVVCFVGLFHKDLGLKEIVLELTKVKKSDLKLLLVGEGDQSWPRAVEDLEKIAKENRLSSQVIFTGRRPYQEVPVLINIADICLLPAYNHKMMQDIVPIKMYEYMAMGKPVIATKLPGVMKEFGNGNGVIYVDRPEDTLKKAVELIENGDIEKEGIKAKKFVEKYNWDKVVDEFEEILEEVVLEGSMISM